MIPQPIPVPALSTTTLPGRASGSMTATCCPRASKFASLSTTIGASTSSERISAGRTAPQPGMRDGETRRPEGHSTGPGTPIAIPRITGQAWPVEAARLRISSTHQDSTALGPPAISRSLTTCARGWPPRMSKTPTTAWRLPRSAHPTTPEPGLTSRTRARRPPWDAANPTSRSSPASRRRSTSIPTVVADRPVTRASSARDTAWPDRISLIKLTRLEASRRLRAESFT